MDHRRPRRTLGRITRKRSIRIWATALIIGAGFASFGTTSAYAVDDHEFQLDGNTVDDAAAAADFDWQSFFNNTAPARVPVLPDASRPGFTASGFVVDNAGEGNSSDGTTFATGSKDTLDIDGWQCGFSNNIGDKVDIVNAYSAVYTVPSGSEQGDTILYFGVEKASPTGSSNIAVWFLQDPDAACASNNGNVDFTGNHTDGDLLVVSEFTNGGAIANVKAYAWVGGPNGSLDPTPVATGGNCATGGTEDDACAIANAAPVDTPWASPDKDTRNDALGVNQFFEGGVNLNNAGLLDACFARFLANTRSSPSLTATIFDYASGELETCAPSTELTLSAGATTILTGTNTSVTITEKNDGINPLLAPTPANTANGGYVTVSSTTGSTCTPTHKNDNPDAAINDGDTNGNGVLDPGESWVFTCQLTGVTASTTLTITGHGIDPLNRDVTYTDENCADSATLLCDADEQKTFAVTVAAPSTELTKKASVTVTYTYEEKNDGNAVLTKPSGGWVTDDKCSPVTENLKQGTQINVGDDNNDGKLDPLETFKFTCTKAATTAGADLNETNRAIGSGVVASLGNANLTWCSSVANAPAGTICDPEEADEVQVQVTHKNPPAQGA